MLSVETVLVRFTPLHLLDKSAYWERFQASNWHLNRPAVSPTICFRRMFVLCFRLLKERSFKIGFTTKTRIYDYFIGRMKRDGFIIHFKQSKGAIWLWHHTLNNAGVQHVMKARVALEF